MLLVFILYAVFAGMTFINSSLMVSDPYPLLVGMFRALGSGVIILFYLALSRSFTFNKLKLSREQWFYLIGYGILVHALAMFGFSCGVMYANPITVCFLYATGPFITAMLLYFYEGVVLTKIKVLGLIIGFIGLAPILFKNIAVAEISNSGHELLGNVIVLVSMIFFCFGWILFKKLISSASSSVQLLNGIAMVIGGILSAITILLLYGTSIVNIPLSANFNVLLFLFVFSSLITYCLYAYLLETFSPTFISFAGFLEPAFALLYGMLFFGYSINRTDIIGFITLSLGLYIFYRQELLLKKS